EPGPTCEDGGVLIATGVDENENGTLDSSEVTASTNVCAGTAGSATDGENGADGDDGDDGAIGQDGDDGENGQNGAMTLSSIGAASAGMCPAGGLVVSFGPDLDRSGTLDQSEISSTATICNGSPAGDTCAPVIKVDPVLPGSICQAGGVIISYGQD